jgi:hypothetical protein
MAEAVCLIRQAFGRADIWRWHCDERIINPVGEKPTAATTGVSAISAISAVSTVSAIAAIAAISAVIRHRRSPV